MNASTHLMKAILGIALAAVTLPAGSATTDSEIERETIAFYKVYLETRPSGVPHARLRAKFAPLVSHTLAQLLERAESAERHYAKVSKNQTPPLIEGDLFTSLFEGAQSFTVKGCERNTAATVCTVELRRDDNTAGKSVTIWSDKVHLVRNGRHWVVDDIEYGGNWQFKHNGRLKELLRKVIFDGTHARP